MRYLILCLINILYYLVLVGSMDYFIKKKSIFNIYF